MDRGHAKGAGSFSRTEVTKVGAPSTYSDDIAAHITTELVNGRSLRAICREDRGIPNVATIIRWLANPEHAEFCAQYARAREAQADILADEVVDIADVCRIGTKTTTKANGDVETVTGDMVERARLQIDARKWFASKLAPKKYSEKLAIGGAEDLPPIEQVFSVSTEALLAIAARKA